MRGHLLDETNAEQVAGGKRRQRSSQNPDFLSAAATAITFAIKIMRRRTKITIAAMFVLLALGAYCYFGRIEYSRKKSPDGKYFEIVSVRPMYYLPLPIYRWGVHSDSSGFITIEDLEGTSFGEAPVALLQSAELTWEPGQAYLGAWAEWDLDARTCFYWNEDQTRKIYSKR